MALRVTQSTRADRAKSYFKESLAREDYYTCDREVTGVWGGSGAERLGLSGLVDEETYFRLVDNIHPETGEPLTPRTRGNRRVGYDFTFSVPKSVSIHYGLLDHSEIENAFAAAVDETMAALEADTHTRVRQGGQSHDRQTGNMVWAGFTHATARPVDGQGPDPHLHRHIFVFNATWDETESRWKAGQFAPLHLKRPYWEARFHSTLARNLRALGYGIERTGTNFELKGYERPTVEKFSKRTEEIEAAASAHGIVDPDRKAQLGAKTRAAKTRGLTTADLREEWWNRLNPSERAVVEAVEKERGRGVEAGDRAAATRALDHAIRGCFERNSVVKRHEFLTAMLKAGIEDVTVDEAHATLERAREAGAVIVADWQGESCVTTPQAQAEEKAMLAFVREGRGASPPLSRRLLETRTDMPADWREAAQAILASRDRVTMLIGKPGTGKTTVMKTVAGELEEQGQRVFAFAPSAIASRGNLRAAGFTDAETLATLFQNEALQAELHGQVIWLDEAGMIGAHDTCRLFEVARERNARIILTGDPNQHKPIDRGDAMRILEDFGDVEPARLNIIRRQREREYRQAATEISEGRVAEGFDRLLEMGAVEEIEDWEERYEKVAKDYTSLQLDQDKSVLVLSPTHHERRAVNAEIRSVLKERGVVGEDERSLVQWENKGWQVSEKADAVYYTPGDKVKFHKAAPGFRAGTGASVEEVDQGRVWLRTEEGRRRALPLDRAERFEVFDERTLTIAPGDLIRVTRNGQAKSIDGSGRKQRLTNGMVYRLDGFTAEGDLALNNGFVVDRNYASLDHGYAITSRGSQSLDEDVVLIAQGHASFPASNTSQFLVDVTRGKEMVRIYTDDREGLEGVIQRSSDRVSATELLEQADEASVGREPEASQRARAQHWVSALAQRYEGYERSREEAIEHRPAEPSRRSYDEVSRRRG